MKQCKILTTSYMNEKLNVSILAEKMLQDGIIQSPSEYFSLFDKENTTILQVLQRLLLKVDQLKSIVQNQ